MLKKRIAATVVVRNGIVVQSIGFKKFLPIGKPDIAIEFLNQWGVDEIILIDISATINNSGPQFDIIRNASKKGFVPLTVGGGISTIEHMRELMNCGADKISINQAALKNKSLITEAAHIFGNQCVVVSLDAMKVSGKYLLYDYRLKKTIDIEVSEYVKEAESLGAGEILVNSIDRDGSYAGFDLHLMNDVCNNVNIPVIAAGGAKNAHDFIEVFTKTKVSAASAANFFNFTEHSVNITKSQIIKQLNIRFETFADYKDADYDKDYKLKKKSDIVLENMLYVKIEKEII
jgi:cyclase